MADAVNTLYIWPPNWDVSQESDVRKVIVQFTSVSDGTGESAVKKFDLSEWTTANGLPAKRTVVEKIEYDAFGFTSIKLEWDRSPKQVIAILSGNNSKTLHGDRVDVDDGTSGTGDILLTSSGGDSGDSYNITLTILLMEN